MTLEQKLLIAAAAIIVALIVTVIALAIKLSPKRKAKADNVKIINGVRYTENKLETTDSGEVAVTHRVGDVVLEKGYTYTAIKGTKLIPGKYTVLSAQESVEKFNLRLGGLVREYSHADDIVLGEGDSICAVSHTVILR